MYVKFEAVIKISTQCYAPNSALAHQSISFSLLLRRRDGLGMLTVEICARDRPTAARSLTRLLLNLFSCLSFDEYHPTSSTSSTTMYFS